VPSSGRVGHILRCLFRPPLWRRVISIRRDGAWAADSHCAGSASRPESR
jgi:hypothetical protein